MSVGAQTASYSASLSGDNEVPAVDSSATGTFTASTDGSSVTYTLSVPSIESVTQAHIHIGAASENGGVVAFLFGPVDGASSIDVTGAITEGDLLGDAEGDMQVLLSALSSGNAYVNVHTTGTPSGEIRGQIGVAAGSLPATGSGGLAGSGGSDVPAWVWAALAAGVTSVALAAGRRALRRR